VDISNVAAIVIYILPGFLATELRYFLVPARKGTDFERLVWSVFFSLLGFLAASLVVLALYKADWRRHTSARDLEFVIPLWFFALLAGILVAQLTKSSVMKAALRKRCHVAYSEFPSIWNEIWQCPEEALFVRVHLGDGSVHFGAVHAYTRDPAEQQRELWLRPTYTMDEDWKVGEQLPGLSLYVRAESIVYVEVYRPEDRPPPAAGNGRNPRQS
jgi:hypothetical protein